MIRFVFELFGLLALSLLGLVLGVIKAITAKIPFLGKVTLRAYMLNEFCRIFWTLPWSDGAGTKTWNMVEDAANDWNFAVRYWPCGLAGRPGSQYKRYAHFADVSGYWGFRDK